ncbi:MAG: hypothetical protein ACK4K2_03225 [Dehalococcoidia bacterium]
MHTGPSAHFAPWRWAVLLLLFALLVVLRTDALRLSPGQRIALPYAFSLEGWEVRVFFRKWLYLLREVLPGLKTPREKRVQSIQRWFALEEEANHLQRIIQRLASLRGANGHSLPVGAWEQGELQALLGRPSRGLAQDLADLEGRLHALRQAQGRLQNLVEEALEAEVSAVLREEGLALPLGLVWPPVDFRFTRPPHLLVVSLRERIVLEASYRLQPDMRIEQMDDVETAILSRENKSALVVELGGLGSYPAMVAQGHDLRATLHLIAHEYLHHYLFFRPLGWHYGTDPDTTSLNETLADMAGREIGDRVYVRLGGKVPPPAPPTPSPPGVFDFNREMRLTRQEVERLLGEGKVEEAERYMEERRQVFVEHGYAIRKLNQAYFAFHGTYAESPASVSPIAGQLQALRRASPSVGAFIATVARFGSYKDFLRFYHAQGLVGAIP